MIPVEAGELSTRRLFYQEQKNEENMRVELEIKQKVQEMVRIKEEVTKLRASRRHNIKVEPRAFQLGNLVWQV